MPKSEPEHVLRMFLFFIKSEADVLINSVLRQNTACKSFHFEFPYKVSSKSVAKW